MRFELFIGGITGFLMYNAYYDGKYTKMLLAYKKYYKIAFIGFIAICIYVTIKRNPVQTKNMLLCTSNIMKYMPVDKSSMDLITPIFDLSTKGIGFMEGFNTELNPGYVYQPQIVGGPRSLPNRPKQVKRAVSETKKKYVASMQDWKCGQCHKKLTHTFEVDHKIRLEHGGGNDVTNLVALCRECHGEKTAMENM
jgi:hypothetical protein